jgi:hypothetical protein
MDYLSSKSFHRCFEGGACSRRWFVEEGTEHTTFQKIDKSVSLNLGSHFMGKFEEIVDILMFELFD